MCGCEVHEFHAPAEWRRWLQQAGFEAAQAAEQPFTLLSPAGFLRDEGLANSLRRPSRGLRSIAPRAAACARSGVTSHAIASISVMSS